MSTTASSPLPVPRPAPPGAATVKPRQGRSPCPSSGGARPGDGLGWRSPHAWVALSCALAIGLGWRSRHELDLVPSDGLGYALGIAGLAMMVLLLGYSIRKRMRALRQAGAMRSWFEAHLILGLIGPTLILYHANFGLGSANATLSLICVLAVSGSGVGGRFLYGRMHRGLAGERRSVGDLRKKARAELAPLEPRLAESPGAKAALARFEAAVPAPSDGLLRALAAVALRPRALLLRGRIRRRWRGEAPPRIQRQDERPEASERRILHGGLATLCRAGELVLFERLFALWHAIHIPLTVILFVSAAVHVVAVHLY